MAGVESPIELFTDASAAKSFASRKGLGRQHHVDTRYLWLQEEVASGRVRLGKVRGELNPADVLTKYRAEGDSVGKAALMNILVSASDLKRSRPRGGVEMHP